MAYQKLDRTRADKNSVTNRNTKLGNKLLADWTSERIDRIELEDDPQGRKWWVIYKKINGP